MSAHESSLGATDEWYTPPEVFEAIGLNFDMDVSSPGVGVVPWIPAKEHITESSLQRVWRGRIWMNPPFGGRNSYAAWAEKFVNHGHGIALAPNRTGARWFQDFALKVHGVFFWTPKVKFIRPDGTRGLSPGYGTVLLSMGDDCTQALRRLHGGNGFFAEPPNKQHKPNRTEAISYG